MFRKMIVFGTLGFLLFEVLYFQSNMALEQVIDQEQSVQVYQLALNENKEDFLANYSDIVLDCEEQSVAVLTSADVIQEIEEKYHIIIEK